MKGSKEWKNYQERVESGVTSVNSTHTSPWDPMGGVPGCCGTWLMSLQGSCVSSFMEFGGGPQSLEKKQVQKDGSELPWSVQIFNLYTSDKNDKNRR